MMMPVPTLPAWLPAHGSIVPFPLKKSATSRNPKVTVPLSHTFANAVFCPYDFKDGERGPACLASPAPFLLQIPLVPLSPALSIILNVYLMLKLSYMTWLRFAVWLLLGECSHGCSGEGNGVCLGTLWLPWQLLSPIYGSTEPVLPLSTSSSPLEMQAEVSQYLLSLSVSQSITACSC